MNAAASRVSSTSSQFWLDREDLGRVLRLLGEDIGDAECEGGDSAIARSGERERPAKWHDGPPRFVGFEQHSSQVEIREGLESAAHGVIETPLKCNDRLLDGVVLQADFAQVEPCLGEEVALGRIRNQIFQGLAGGHIESAEPVDLCDRQT